MTTKLEPALQRVTLPESPCMECPLHRTMEEIAHAAVKQHVLYLEGECQPRPELLHLLETWSSLHTLIRARICVASRTSVIAPDALERVLVRLLPLTDASIQTERQNIRAALAACARATTCPMGSDPHE